VIDETKIKEKIREVDDKIQKAGDEIRGLKKLLTELEDEKKRLLKILGRQKIFGFFGFRKRF
jgi:hypothetical protein